RILHSAFGLAARVGLAPTPRGLTGRRATLTLPGIGTAGRISTCIVPLRRRMPHVFSHGSVSMRNVEFGLRNEGCIPHSAFCIPHWKGWSARQELHLRSLGPKPSMLAA